MSTDPTKTESSLEEQLVAYLDGELDAESARRIEERLAGEPEVREALNRLEQTWEMLDELGATPVGDNFTRTTLEMVAVAAEEDIERAKAEVPLRRRRRRWLLGTSVLATVAAGFFAAYLFLPNPNRELVEDLPVLENLEEYLQVDDIKFLRLLKEKELFPAVSSAVKEPTLLENQPNAERAERIDRLSREEKADLLQKKDIFDKLGDAEKQKLGRLCKEVRRDAEAVELHRIMRDYYEWWKNLPSYFRNDLSSLSSPQERVKRVEQLKQEELKRNPAIILAAEDVAVLREWMERYVKNFETKHREAMSDADRKKWDEMPKPQQRRELMRFLLWPHGPNGNRMLQLPEDLADLRSKFTAATQKTLEGKSPEEQWKKILNWLPAIARQQMASRMGRRPGSLVDDNEIAKFFESLPDEERMRLLELTPEDMQHELQGRYLSRMKPMESFLIRPEGPPPPGGFRGPRNNPDRKPPNDKGK